MKDKQPQVIMPSILVIADLHLEADRPDITQCFFDFLQQVCDNKEQYQSLYILGDLFEVWIGDDNPSPFNQEVADKLKQTSEHLPIYYIHGNRDFLIGKKYARKSGMQLLPEQHQITAFGKEILFMHGDQLCLEDVEYQKFRKKSRSWWWQTIMLALPLSYRMQKARNIRERSKSNKMNKAADIMDVAEYEVKRVLAATGCDWLVHGHTHRPNIHHYDEKQRIVVGDWYTQGSVLELSEQGAILKQLTFQNNSE